jgi:hypothetical protein
LFSGQAVGVVRVDVGTPYGREVVLRVRHDSERPRSVTVLPTGTIRGANGGFAPTVRLTTATGEATRELAPGQTEEWRFNFEMDANCTETKAVTGFDITGEGLPSGHVAIEIRRRNPLLGPWIRWGAVFAAVLFSLKAIRSFWRWCSIRRLCTDAEWTVTEQRPLLGFFKVIPAQGQECQVTLQQSLLWHPAAERTPRPYDAQRSIRVNAATVSEQTPIRFQPADGTDVPQFEIQQCRVNDESGPELEVVVKDGGAADEQAQSCKRSIFRGFAVALGFAVLALTIYQPFVLECLQWSLDLIFHP